jgi:hypothetical protein
LTPLSGRFTTGKRPGTHCTVQDAGWAPGPVWTSAENLASTGIRSLYRPSVASRHIFTTVTILIEAFLPDYAVQDNMIEHPFKGIRLIIIIVDDAM